MERTDDARDVLTRHTASLVLLLSLLRPNGHRSLPDNVEIMGIGHVKKQVKKKRVMRYENDIGSAAGGALQA